MGLNNQLKLLKQGINNVSTALVGSIPLYYPALFYMEIKYE